MSFRATLDTSRLAAKLAAASLAATAGNRQGVAAGAALFEDGAKNNAPVQTGRLRDGIHTETVVDTNTQTQLMVTPVVDAANKEGFEPPYARRIELGFIGIDSLGRHYHQAPEPYMRPAFDEQKDAALQAHEDAVREALKGVA
jgi:Bacteriophage HK97-gp10, putative tail-component